MRALAALSAADLRFLVEAMVVLPLVALLLRLGGFRRTSGWLRRSAPFGTPPKRAVALTDEQLRSWARLVVAAAARSPVRSACLARSLAFWWLLRRRGIDSELRIGVRREGGQLLAHAWLERGGVVLNDAPDVGARFNPFTQTGSADTLKWV